MSDRDPVAEFDARIISDFQENGGDSAKAKSNRDPWERQQGETTKSYAAFVEYLNLGSSRSFAKLGKKLGKTPHNFQEWSVKHGWVRRAEAFDIEQDRIYFAELKQQRKTMAKRHAEQAQKIQLVAMKALEKKFGPNLERLTEEDLSNTELLRFLDAATKMERIALGEPGDIVENQMTGGNHDSDRKPVVPLTHTGRIQQALDLLEAARERATATDAEQSD